MKNIAWLLLCCLVCFSVASCTQKEESEEPAAEEAVTQEEAVAEDVAEEVAVEEGNIVGKWEITEWKADHVDQFEMWRIGTITVDFLDDSSVALQLVYANGDERSSKGTWKRDGDKLEVHMVGETETEGDEPFERTREFTIDELTESTLSVRSEIGPAEKPIVLGYKANRQPAAE